MLYCSGSGNIRHFTRDMSNFQTLNCLRIPLLLLVFFLCLLLSPGAIAETKTSQKASAKTPAASVTTQAKPVINGVTQAAFNAGVKTCAGRINQVTNFLTAGTKGSGAFLFVPPANPDQQMFSVSMEIPTSASTFAYASASFAPNQANGCGGMYETVVYWPQNCNAVAKSNFANLKVSGVVAKNIAILDAGVSTRIFLMPAGAGCVSIKKEIIQ